MDTRRLGVCVLPGISLTVCCCGIERRNYYSSLLLFFLHSTPLTRSQYVANNEAYENLLSGVFFNFFVSTLFFLTLYFSFQGFFFVLLQQALIVYLSIMLLGVGYMLLLGRYSGMKQRRSGVARFDFNNTLLEFWSDFICEIR